MTIEQMRAVHAAAITAARSELVLALDVAVADNERLRRDLDGMTKLVATFVVAEERLRREVDRLESAMREDRRQRGLAS